MKIVNAVRIVFIIIVISACQNSQKDEGSIENAKYHSSKKIVNPNLFIESLNLVFGGSYAFDAETYLAPSFLASNNIRHISVIDLNEAKIKHFFPGTRFDTLNADFLTELSVSNDGRISEFTGKGMGEYESEGEVYKLKYNSNNLLQSLETQSSYGNALYEYFYNDNEEIKSKRVSENGNLSETLRYVKDSTIDVTYQISNSVYGAYTGIKIIKYNGVISEKESSMARNKLAELIEAKEGDFEQIKEVNNWLQILSYQNGLKMREESWDLKTDSLTRFTDYIYWNSSVLIKTKGKHDILGKYFDHSKEFLYNKNGDLKTVLDVFEQPKTLDEGTLTSKYEFVYDAKGFLLELIEYRNRQGRVCKLNSVC
ncbi:MAG: hypothetical protein ACJA1C_002879 [Crocinitomicaceae bacterium]|jgi:hypothetical protein